jgi:Domain of unknown function DUF11
MRVLRLAAVRSYAVIGAAAVLLAVSLLASRPASAASSTTTAELVTTITPTFQKKAEPFGCLGPTWPSCHFAFTAVVTNNGPDPASNVVVSVSGCTATLGFSASPNVSCSASTTTFSCPTLPVGAAVTAAIGITRYCLGQVCYGALTATAASSVTPANSSASGQWELLCGIGKCII